MSSDAEESGRSVPLEVWLRAYAWRRPRTLEKGRGFA